MTSGIILVATVATVYIVFSLTRWNGHVSIFRQVLLMLAIAFDIWFGLNWFAVLVPLWVPVTGVALVWAIISGLTRHRRY